jgi:hypothetical protein
MNVSATKASTVQSTQRSTQLQQTEQKAAALAQAQPKQPEMKKYEAQRPTPVVNTQGHTTGRIIHMTA